MFHKDLVQFEYEEKKVGGTMTLNCQQIPLYSEPCISVQRHQIQQQVEHLK